MKIKKLNKLKVISIKFSVFVCLSSFINAHAEPFVKEDINSIDISYLESRRELEDYLLDTGDILDISFLGTTEFDGLYPIDTQGEIYFSSKEDIKGLYVRGLTIYELKALLENLFKDILFSPEINIRISTYKALKIVIAGEVRTPGIIKFDSFKMMNEEEKFDYNLQQDSRNLFQDNIPKIDIKKSRALQSTLSNAIRKSGGLTSYSDISKLEITRDIPIGKGGGKKRAIID